MLTWEGTANFGCTQRAPDVSMMFSSRDVGPDDTSVCYMGNETDVSKNDPGTATPFASRYLHLPYLQIAGKQVCMDIARAES